MRVRVLLVALLAVVGAVAALAAAQAPKAPAPDAALCSAPYHVAHAGWEFCWQLDDMRVQGLELNDVRYQGKRVFWKVGVPLSITRYHNNQFGPFKDALGNVAAAGVQGFGNGSLAIDAAHCPRWLGQGTLLQDGRVCLETIGGATPRVALWSRFDLFNYRFVNGYVLHADGTFEPKVMLGGTLLDQNVCRGSMATSSGCAAHFHHVYWRFDLDVDGAANDTIQEFHRVESNVPPAVVVDQGCSPRRGGPWCDLAVEAPRLRDPATYTKWRVADASSLNERGSRRSFELLSESQGPGDAVSPFDAFALAYKGDSAQLGYEVVGRPTTDDAILRYANGEVIRNADVVLWYVEHVFHEPRDEEIPTMQWHTVGPKVLPRNFHAFNQVEATWP